MSGLTLWLASVRGRLTIAVSALFAVMVFSGGWFLLSQAEAAWVSDLQAQDIAELEQLAQDLQAIEAAGSAFGIQLFPLPVGADGTTYTLTDDEGAIFGATPGEVFSSRGIIGSLPPEAFPEGDGFIIDAGFRTFDATMIGEVVSVSLPVELEQGVLTLIASSSLAPVRAGVDALTRTLWIAGPLLVAAVGILAWFVTGRAFQPVAAITAQVENITDGRLDERVPVPQSQDEVAHLAQTMNAMLDRLSAGRRRQRQFVSDASHELRNPIATSKARLEVGLAHADDTDWEEVASIVLEEQNRLSQLVDDLLLLARLDEGHTEAHQEVDLDDIIFSEATRYHNVPINVDKVRPTKIVGEPKQLTRLVRNLLDNATRYASTKVAVTLTTEDGIVRLNVEDDGPGVPEGDRVRVLERFIRPDDARTRNDGGAGLGLAIVQGVAEAHGGTVIIGESSLGGALLVVELPPARKSANK